MLGICCRDGNIWVKSDDNTLTLVDTYGKVNKQFQTTFNPCDFCVHSSGSIFCTSFSDHAIYKVSPEGEECILYQHRELNYPHDITEDEDGYIYVSGNYSHNIHRISPHGHHYSIVLTKEDGIRNPSGLDYNKNTKQLMVICMKGGESLVYIYNVA